VPKKALLIYFGLAFFFAVIFVWFTFPGSVPNKFSISKNQPEPRNSTPPLVQPEGHPQFVTIPTTPPAPATGVVLHILAWGQGEAAERLQQQIDLFSHDTGIAATEVMANTEADYQKALAEAYSSGAVPDVILVNGADFSGLTPARDLLPLPAAPGRVLSSVAGTFVRNGQNWAQADEFSVDVLFYNKSCFDRVGLGYPGVHWTLDTLQGISRGLTISNLLDPEGKRIFALELPCDFQLWNLLSKEAGHALYDNSGWHITNSDAQISQQRGLEFFQTYFRDLDVCAPLTNDELAPGDLFFQGRACLLIAPIEAWARFQQNGLLRWDVTRFPQDLTPSTNLRVQGWAVTKLSRHPTEAIRLVQALGNLPLHDGWVAIKDSLPDGSTDDVPALARSLLPNALFYTLDAKTKATQTDLTAQLQHFSQTNDDVTIPGLYQRLIRTIPGAGPMQVETGLPQARKKK
jgi:ABC-type glycerol-3-phosphate transport system substrate-binding protein